MDKSNRADYEVEAQPSLRALLAQTPLGWVGRAQSWLAGIPTLSEALRDDPQNPFLLLKCAAAHDRKEDIAQALRSFRMFADPHHAVQQVLLRLGLTEFLDAIDGPIVRPQLALALSAVEAAIRQLEGNEEHDGLWLALGVSCLLVAREAEDLVWLLRAKRTFEVLLRQSCNQFICADAATGMSLAFSLAGNSEISTRYLVLAKGLGADSSYVGGKNRTPSIFQSWVS